MTVGEGSSAGGAAAAEAAAVAAGTVWRYLDLGAIDAFESNAQLPVVVRDVATTGPRLSRRASQGRTHLNVGWFDDVDETVDLEEAARKGIQVIRRPFYGGGTAFYGEDARQRGLFCFRRPRQGTEPATQGSRWTTGSRYQPVVLDFLAGCDSRRCSSRDRARPADQWPQLGALTAQDIVALTTSTRTST